ncbi:MAG: hypothetical protein M3519_10585 [Actinomycetota bacterium]|nr:hypothetical protein [Actinomycetota bacterium]
MRGTGTTQVATLKGDARMAQVLRRAGWSRVHRADAPLVVPRGSRKWRIPAHDVQDVLDELAGRGVRYEAARAMLLTALENWTVSAVEE